MKKLSEWAKEQNMSYKEAWAAHQSGALPVKTKISKTNRIYVLEEAQASKSKTVTFATPAFAESDEKVSTASVRRNRSGTIAPTNEYYHIERGVMPYSVGRSGKGGGNDSIDPSEVIRLVQQCYFNFSDFRNIIDVLTEFTANNIYWRGGNKKSRDFFKALWNKNNLNGIQDKFYREYYRSGTVVPYRFEAILNDEDVSNLNKLYGSEAAKKTKLPVKYVIINPASIVCGGAISFADSKFYQKLNEYEIQRLIKPITPEDEAFLNSLPKDIKKIFTSGKASSGLHVEIPLNPEYCYFIFYKKQDYEPVAVPMGWPVLKDINFKAELKAIDMAVARTTQRAILVVTMGFEDKDGNYIFDAKAAEAMRQLFESESVGKVLVADFTTEVKWAIPEVDKLLGPEKYKQVNEDIRTGLNNVLAGGDEKFANQSIKVKLFIQRLKQSREVFLNEFLIPEVKRISKDMGFKSYPIPVYEDLDWKDEDLFARIVAQLAGIGFLTAEEAFTAMETGRLPTGEESEEAQRKFKLLKDEGLYQAVQQNPSSQLEVLSETNKQAIKLQDKQNEHDDKQKSKDRKHAADNPQSPAPQIVLNAPTKLAQPKGKPAGSNGPGKKTKPAKPSKAGISATLLKENLILASDLNKQLEEKVINKFKVEKLNETQSKLKDVLLESIMMNEPSSNWTNAAVLEEYIKNPDKKNEERLNLCLATGEEHQVNDYLAGIIVNSLVDVKEEENGEDENNI